MFIPIQIPAGVLRGASSDDYPGRWYNATLIRWRDGVLEPVGGWTKKSGIFTYAGRRIIQWRDNVGAKHILVGTDGDLRSDGTGSFVDVKPHDFVPLTTYTSGGYGSSYYGKEAYGTARTGFTSIAPKRAMWSLSTWGEDVLAVASSDGRLIYFDSSNSTSATIPVGEYAVDTIARASNVVTVSTTLPHHLTTGDHVSVLGVTNATMEDGNATVTVIDSDTFTYPNTGADASSSGGTVTDLSVPLNNRAVIVTNERHAMMIGVAGNPYRVGWSSREDYTDWNFSSVVNTAGYLDLKSETPLFTLGAVREGILVWSENKVFLGRYIGQPFIYGFDAIAEASIYSPYSFAEFDGRCVFMDRSGFRIYEGGAIKQLPCPLNDYIFSSIDKTFGPRVAHASANGLFNEVWFFFPSDGNAECNKYVIWNYAENWWSMGSLERSAMFPAGAGEYPLMMGAVTGAYRLWQHEDGWLGSGKARSIFAESAVLNLPGAEATLQANQGILSVGGGYDKVTLTAYTRMTPNGAQRTFGPYSPRSDGYVDIRITGRDVRLRVDEAVAGDWSIGRMRFKVAAGGKR